MMCTTYGWYLVQNSTVQCNIFCSSTEILYLEKLHQEIKMITSKKGHTSGYYSTNDPKIFTKQTITSEYSWS